MNQQPETSIGEKPLKGFLAHAACGLLMGGADIIPGVSGGTVALVLGIYRRFVTALSHFDGELLRLVSGGRWKLAALHVDLGFLVALGCGILTGIVSLGGIMNQLLSDGATRPSTLAALFGLILSSAWLVARMIRTDQSAARFRLVLIGIAAAVFAAWLTGLPAMSTNLSPYYVFLCGAIAISAMILPGISGAYLLLILGLYSHLTDILKGLPRGDVDGHDVFVVAVFAGGCALGLLTFSKVLRFLLNRFNSVTMAVLCGFMIGALRKLWPFQEDMTPDVDRLSHKIFRTYIPEAIDAEVLWCVAFAVLAAAAVLMLDKAARRRLATKHVDSLSTSNQP